MIDGVTFDKIADESQSAKADAGKLQISLVPTQIIRDIAVVRAYGNKKIRFIQQLEDRGDAPLR